MLWKASRLIRVTSTASGSVTKLVELAGRTDGAPQPGKAASQHDDSLGSHHEGSLVGPIGTAVVAVDSTAIVLATPGRRTQRTACEAGGRSSC